MREAAPTAMSEKALIAMSGGVDSSVAALLTKARGLECLGVTMKLYDSGEMGEGGGKTCCALADVEDARSVAFRLGIPYYVFNDTEEFRTQVMDRFVSAYESGATPNPCIDCNRYLKFDRLFRRALELGCRYMATGHYARIGEERGRYLLKKARDESKDQTYFLYTMTQEQLGRTLFPLGELTKGEVRALAEAQGFYNARKPDSQDICFVPDGDYGAFLERWRGKEGREGDILDRSGRVIGRHRGAARYTLGQRKGLGLAVGRPVYVCGKDMEKNTVTVGPEEELYERELYAGEMNWIAGEAPAGPLRVGAKVRSCQREQGATVFPEGDGGVRVLFDEPQRAITPGQAVVFYAGDVVVGGGEIKR